MTRPAADKTFEALSALRDAVAREGRTRLDGWGPDIIRARYAPSAANLAYYLALRKRDLRELQEELMVLGLSSLGRCESRVLENIDATLHALAPLAGRPRPTGTSAPDAEAFFRGTRLLQENTAALFGPLSNGRAVHVMVTMAAELAEDVATMDTLVAAGMRVARINCAKDDPEVWARIAANARRAGEAQGRPVRIALDLCGPRARTGTVWAKASRRTQAGDRVLLTAEPAEKAKGFDFVVEASLPEVLGQLRSGAAVTVDEGALVAAVRAPGEDRVELEVVGGAPNGIRLKPNKGMNFPGTALELDPLTTKDRADLDAIAGLVDIVEYSFVQSSADIRRLHTELRARGRDPAEIGIVAKIETGLAVTNLPDLIVAGAGAGPFGVMIARGDLAVEIGYRRLAEIQEELLWLCEAAHVPIIWATEVMSSFVRKGRPTRSEMTDAAMAERAECVMLNKGPFLTEAVQELTALLERMEGHQRKKVSRLRALQSW